MEAIKKQATKFREQVARQQQAVFKQFGGGGYGGSDNLVTDEPELRLHQKLEKLYISTRAAKHFQRDIVRGVEGYIVTGSKQVEIGTKLSEDSRKYGVENTCTSGSTLSRAAKNFSRARALMEKERGNLLKSFGTQVAEPLRAMVMGAPLEDARHLAQRYDRMRQEAEAQAVEVSKRQARVREGTGNPDIITKLEAAESKLQDLKSNMAILGREAASAMAAVEGQQQKMTLQRLISMIESERAYHQKVLQILDHLEGEMVSERQRIEAAPIPPIETPPPPSYEEVNNAFISPTQNGSNDEVDYFLGEVMYSFQAESDVELNLSLGDYVVIRKVSNNGWAEGECKGKAGWFPLGYIESRERVLASKVAEPLRAMVMGAPLEDGRHLAQRYDRMRQEAEAQAVEVTKRQARVREGTGNPDIILKLEAAESKLQDLKSNMAILGREAASAMTAVEGQQQKMTLQILISMIELERGYHQKVLQILDQLEGEMVSERQRIEAAPTPPIETPPPPSYEEVNNAFTSPTQNGSNDEVDYFLGEVMYSFQAESDVELNLSLSDYVVIRKVSNNGWAEGECKGKAGWFPLGYIERRERVLASKVTDIF